VNVVCTAISLLLSTSKVSNILLINGVVLCTVSLCIMVSCSSGKEYLYNRDMSCCDVWQGQWCRSASEQNQTDFSFGFCGYLLTSRKMTTTPELQSRFWTRGCFSGHSPFLHFIFCLFPLTSFSQTQLLLLSSFQAFSLPRLG